MDRRIRSTEYTERIVERRKIKAVKRSGRKFLRKMSPAMPSGWNSQGAPSSLSMNARSDSSKPGKLRVKRLTQLKVKTFMPPPCQIRLTMSLRRAVPNFQHLFRQLEDNVSSMLSRIPTSMNAPSSSMEGPSWMASTPTADVHETDSAYVIEAELPGIKKENVNMELLDDHTLRLTGAFKEEREEKGRQYWTRERMAGEFRRTFSFPDTINPDRIHASMDSGLLKVEIEKSGEQAKKKLPIKIE